jgi:non-ribosomal peptide synthetase component F
MTPPPEAQTCPRPTNAFASFDARDLDGSIAGRFEQQVRRFPDRLAVECPRQRFTYAELNRASNRIAHAILDLRGEGSEPVALLCGQGALLIAAILGVLKAGKIYVPLDGRHPRGRLLQAIEDAAPAVLLCDRGFRALADRLAPSSATVLDIVDLDRALPDGNPGLSFPSTTPAYIYYTSGSTGRPKGVVDTHRNVLHNVMRYTVPASACLGGMWTHAGAVPGTARAGAPRRVGRGGACPTGG